MVIESSFETALCMDAPLVPKKAKTLPVANWENQQKQARCQTQWVGRKLIQHVFELTSCLILLVMAGYKQHDHGCIRSMTLTSRSDQNQPLITCLHRLDRIIWDFLAETSAQRVEFEILCIIYIYICIYNIYTYHIYIHIHNNIYIYIRYLDISIGRFLDIL